MGRGQVHSLHVRAAAVKLFLEGKDNKEIAEALGVPFHTVRRWTSNSLVQMGAVATPKYERTAEELGNLVYDTVTATLRSLRSRAIETGNPNWIRRQDATALAAMDTAQGQFVIRVINSFEPRNRTRGDPAALPEPDPARNGAVDSAD